MKLVNVRYASVRSSDVAMLQEPIPGWLMVPSDLPVRSNTSITLDAFRKYVTAMRPLPNETASITASARSGTMSRQWASSERPGSAATTRPFGAPFVVCTKSVPPMTVPDARPGVPTETTCRVSVPVLRYRSKSATHRSFDLVSIQ